YKKENVAPYALWGDTGGNYTPGPAFQLGTYTIEGIAFENSNLGGEASAPLVITFNVVNATDTIKPVITLLGDNPLDLIQGQTYNEAGATAFDNLEGDISGNIVIDASAVNTNLVGSYSVTYNVSDLAGNAALEVVRVVNVNEPEPDTTAPVITLLGVNPVNLTIGDTYIEAGATALDDVYGDISTDIVIDASAVNTALVGVYNVTYNVSDPAGNAALEVIRIVNVNPDTTAPIIVLLGQDPVILAVGAPYTEPGAVAMDDVDGDISGSIIIDASNVDVNVAGVYIVTYNVSDLSGNAADEVIRTVVVNDEQCLAEINGEVVIEAENFTNSTFGTGSASGSSWEIYSDGTASQGSAVRAIPNTGVFTRGNLIGPRLDYEVEFTTVGTYRLWVRLGGPTSDDNSIHAGIDGTSVTATSPVSKGIESLGGFAWVDEHDRGTQYIDLVVSTPGVHTINLWMREDGVLIDKLIMQIIPSTPSGYGPPETLGNCSGAPANSFATRSAQNAETGNILEKADFNIYPVPASDRLTIEFNSDVRLVQNIRIIDMVGREVKMIANPVEKLVKINISNLDAGMYMIQSVSGNQVVSKPFTIVR
ncbi:MAG: DUF5011 domain-containing protein, partial [Bacteroidetes bacterium]|nr:DUF5011 domain-containing protein [Bacteroidota bacterium]